MLKSTNKKILEISNAHLSYDAGKSFVLRDISFSLWEWEILSIIGKNGTGKSTLLKAIAGTHPLYAGKMVKNTKQISYIPQKISLEKDFPLRVGEFLKIFNTSFLSEKAHELMRLFNVEDFMERNIHTLSGGEFQRVLIVNSLLSNPELLLMDEPTSGIDLIGEEQFYENISQIQKVYPQISIILVSHNLHLVYKNSTRVICLHENNLCCHGTPSEILKNEDINQVFGKYLRPYEHSPHSHHHHTH